MLHRELRAVRHFLMIMSSESSLAQIQRPQNVPLVENRRAVPTWRPPTNNRGPSRLTILLPSAESIRMSLNVVPDNRGGHAGGWSHRFGAAIELTQRRPCQPIHVRRLFHLWQAVF